MQEAGKNKLGLIPKLIIGIVAGLIIGQTALELGQFGYIVMQLIETFRLLFGQIVLFFVIPLIILAFVTTGIAEIGEGASKYLGIVVGMAFGLTIVSGFIALGAIAITEPLILERGAAAVLEDANPVASVFVDLAVPPAIPTMTAIVLAFILGSFMSFQDESSVMRGFFREFRDIIMGFVQKVVVPGLPWFIGTIFARFTWQGQAVLILATFLRVFIVILIVHWAWLLVHYTICGRLYGVSPFKLLKPMMGSYFMAIGTMSSAATLTVNLPNIKKMGVSEKSANFVAPLCATINLPGSTISIVACAVAVMYLYNVPITFGVMATFILMVSIAMVAAPGVPGGAIMAALGMLSSILNFTDYQLALMIALYFAQDSFGTAVNVTTDGAIALYLDRIMGNKKLEPRESS